MSQVEETASVAPARRSRDVLVSFLGSIVRRLGGWMPIGGTVELMTQFGLDAPSVRTAVFRLKQRGWLVSEARAGLRGYTLTAGALSTLAAGDEVIWRGRQPAELADGWCIVNFSVPESASRRRHQLRAHLASLGFGNVSTALWIAPARMQPAADRAIAELGLTNHCAVFVGAYVGGQDLGGLLYDSWDLKGIDRRYRAFLDRYEAQASELGAAGVIDPRGSFVTYLDMIDHWRRLPFRDPGLPRELLAEDWGGPSATALFERLVTILEGRALAYAVGFWPTEHGTAPRERRRRG